MSLASVGQWVRSLGRLSPQQAFIESTPFPARTAPPEKEIWNLGIEWLQSSCSDNEGQKKMRTVRHAAILSATPVKEGESALAPMRLDSHEASW